MLCIFIVLGVFVAIAMVLVALGKCLDCPCKLASLNLSAEVVSDSPAASEETSMTRIERTPITFSDAQRSLFSIAPLDGAGNPSTVGPFAWSVTSEVPAEGQIGQVVSMVPALDGLSAQVSGNVPGTAEVEVTSGELTEFIKVTITSATAGLASLNLSAAAPVQK